MFNYNYHEDLIKKLIIGNSAPIQVELQPGTGCGGYKCKFCYGQKQELIHGEELTLQDYYRLLDDLKGKTKFITMAGINTDPLVHKNIYDIIKRVKENGFRLGIHTKGLLLNSHIANLLTTDTDYGDFITFSIDSSDESVYNKLHVLPEKGSFFETIKKNIAYLYKRKKSTKSNLHVNVSYLLFKDNSSKEQLEKFIQIFDEISDRIRFTIPQVPNKDEKKPDYYLNSSDEEDVRKIIKELKEKYSNKNEKIIFLDFKNHEHKTDFKYCYAQRFQAVIDHCGYVFPCPQVTTRKYQQITYGSIKNKSFWEVWDSDNKKRIFDMEVGKMACRICDRKDEALNIEFSKMFNNGKVS